jgi:fucose permease
VLGAGAIFLYVGAEVSVGSNLINFLHALFLLPMTAYALICAFAVRAAKAPVVPVGETTQSAAPQH